MNAAEVFTRALADEARAVETVRACGASLAATVAHWGAESAEALFALADWREAIAAAEDAEGERAAAARAVLVLPVGAVTA